MTRNGYICNEPNTIGDIGQEKNYNTEDQEKYQDLLEREFSYILEKFIKEPNPGNSLPSYIFVKFVSFMIGNNIYTRKQISELLGKMELFIQSREIEYSIPIVKEHRRRLDLSLAFAQRFFEVIKNWTFVNVQTCDNQKAFITSDNPVSIFNPENVFISENIHVEFSESAKIKNTFNDDIISGNIPFTIICNSVSLGQDIVMIFPVTPNLCVIGFSDSDRHKENESYLAYAQAQKLINIMTYHQCNRAVYSHSKTLLEETKTYKDNFHEYCQRNDLTPSFDTTITWL